MSEIQTPTLDVVDSGPETPSPERPAAPKPTSFLQKAKQAAKNLPFFPALDFYRRRIWDSRVFDSFTRPLAKTLEDWPRALLIDITNRCNAKCVWCPNPDLTHVGSMDMDLYRRIIDDYGTRGGVITFGTFGEPLMDKNMRERIEYLKRYPKIHKIEVLTNAFFLNGKIVPTLLDQEIGVDISLDELDRETFERVKKMSYEVVRDNILTFLEANERRPRPVPVNIRIKTLKTVRETVNQDLFQRISDHNCTIVLNSIDDNIISNWAGKLDKQAFLADYEIPSNGSQGYSHKQFNISNTAPCTQLWKWMVLYWDGSVVLCCADMFARHVVGNLKTHSIAEIWNGPTMKELRSKMIGRQRFDVPLCQDCDIHLSWHNLNEYYDSEGKFRPERRFIMG